jgi:hypothetical protein
VTGRMVGVLLLLLIWTCLAAVLGPLIGDFLRRAGQLAEQPLSGVPQPRPVPAPRTAAASTNPQLVAAPNHLPEQRSAS